jgi:hypothetical protein
VNVEAGRADGRTVPESPVREREELRRDETNVRALLDVLAVQRTDLFEHEEGAPSSAAWT